MLKNSLQVKFKKEIRFSRITSRRLLEKICEKGDIFGAP